MSPEGYEKLMRSWCVDSMRGSRDKDLANIQDPPGHFLPTCVLGPF